MKTALAESYRLIDTAAAYLNEEQVGQARRESNVDRVTPFFQSAILPQIFITPELSGSMN